MVLSQLRGWTYLAAFAVLSQFNFSSYCGFLFTRCSLSTHPSRAVLHSFSFVFSLPAFVRFHTMTRSPVSCALACCTGSVRIMVDSPGRIFDGLCRRENEVFETGVVVSQHVGACGMCGRALHGDHGTQASDVVYTCTRLQMIASTIDATSPGTAEY